MHVVHGRAVLRSDRGYRDEAAARQRLHRCGVQGMPGCYSVADYAPWKELRLVLSVNPLRGTVLGKARRDPAFTERVMHNCRQAIGRRCVFDNHDLDPTKLARPLYRIYAYTKQLGPEIEFQTGSDERPRTSRARSRWAFPTARARSSSTRTTAASPWCRTPRLKLWASWLEKNSGPATGHSDPRASIGAIWTFTTPPLRHRHSFCMGSSSCRVGCFNLGACDACSACGWFRCASC